MKTIRTQLNTRQEIIDIWKDQSTEHLNTFVCPNCRDLLYDGHDETTYYCTNCNVTYKQIKQIQKRIDSGDIKTTSEFEEVRGI